MSLELLTPVDDEVLESLDLLPKQVIRKQYYCPYKKIRLARNKRVKHCFNRMR